MAIKKQFLKSKPICKVKFTLPKAQAAGAEQVHIVGEFNDWDQEATAMTRLKNGSFTATLDLPKNSNLQFRYLADADKWINEENADGFVPGNVGEEQNCVLSL